MPKFQVTVEYAGYIRMEKTYLVEADTAEEANESYHNGELIRTNVVRDDTQDNGAVCDARLDDGESS